MSNSDIDSGDPWDLISPPEPPASETPQSDGDDSQDAPVPPPPPPTPDTSTPEAHALTAPAGDTEGIEMPDLDAPVAASALDEGPGTEAPDLDAGDLDIGGLDIAGLDADDAPDLDFPELEVPDLDMAGIEPTPFEVTDISPDLDLDTPIDIDTTDIDPIEIDALAAEAADALEMPTGPDFDDIDIADPDGNELTDDSATAGPASRGPLSAMLAGTGLFGDAEETTETTEDADIEEEAEAGDSVPDLSPATDSSPWTGADSELPDNGPDWLEGESDLVMEGSEPPSVYRELEDLTPEVATSEIETADAESDDETIVIADTPVGDFAAVYGTDDLGDEEAEESFGVSFGDDSEVEEVPIEAADDDIARVAAMVADVEPIVAGEDDSSVVDTDGPGTDLSDLDWLDGGDDIELPAVETVGEESNDAIEDGEAPADFSIPEVRFGDETAPDTGGASDGFADAGVSDMSGIDVIDEAGEAVSVPMDPEPMDSGPFEPEPIDSGSIDSGLGDLEFIEIDDAAADPFDTPETAVEIAGDEYDSEPDTETAPADPFDADTLADFDHANAAEELLDLDEAEHERTGDTSSRESIDADSNEATDLLEESGAAAAVGSGVVAGAGAVAWGSRWEQSQQGWVDGEWRPIVTTSETLATWTVDVYLGVVVGDTLITAVSPETLSQARSRAESAMVDEATARGAHAVLGVNATVEQVGDQTLITSTGTAVTLVALDTGDAQ